MTRSNSKAGSKILNRRTLSALLTGSALALSGNSSAFAGAGLKGNFSDNVSNSSAVEGEKINANYERVRAQQEAETARRERAAAEEALTRVRNNPRATDAEKEVAQNRADKAKQNESTANSKLANADSNKISRDVYGGDIANTANQIETGQIVTQATMLGGQTITSIQGQLATQKAAQEGTQSAAMKSGASLATTSGIFNMAVGAMNLWYASQHHKQMGEHETNEMQLEEDFVKGKASKNLNAEISQKNSALRESGKGLYKSNAAYAERVRAEIETQNKKNADETSEAYNSRIDTLLDQRAQSEAASAISEQSRALSAAKSAMAQNLVTGSVAMLNGAATMAAANQMKSAANRLNNIQNGNLPTYTPSTVTGPGDQLGGNSATITGDGSSKETAAANSDTPSNNDSNGLGDPFGVQPPATPPANTPEVKMSAGGPGNPGGGGGGGGLGGANTSPNTAASEGDPQSRMADNSRGSGYEGSGGGFRGAGGSGKGSGPDLSGLLAQFLPKKDEDANKNGIMDYRSRAIASDDNASLLDRNANLFERIHNTYQLKQKNRSVGI